MDIGRRISFVLIVLFILPATALGAGGDQIWMFPGIEDIHAFVTLPDVDGDGVADVVLETYDAGASGDHLICVSGADGALVWSCRPASGASDGGGYGDNCLARAADLSGDGFPDVLIGTAWGNRSVHAVDGRTGDVLWTFDTYDEADSGWVYSVDTIPDWTGDGVPEVVCAAGSDNDNGYLLSGADGAKIWTFPYSYDALMLALPLGDLDGDGASEILFCGGDNEHRVFCVPGAGSGTVTPLWSRDTGGANHAACLIDDITGDNRDDVVVGNWAANHQVKCLDAATGIVRWSFDNGDYNCVMRLVAISDVDGDGLRDVVVGSYERAVRVISGANGQLIWQSWVGTVNGGDCWAVDRLDDVNGDGLDEVVAGSFDEHVYLFDGADGAELWSFDAGHRLYTVRGSADLSGSGCADVLAGTQCLSGVGGLAFAVEGGALTAVAEPDAAPDAGPLAAKLHPNPFNPRTTVELTLERPSRLALRVHDIRGRLLESRDLGERGAGSVAIDWTAEDAAGRPLPAGVYLLTVAARGDGREASRTLRAVLVK